MYENYVNRYIRYNIELLLFYKINAINNVFTIRCQCLLLLYLIKKAFYLFENFILLYKRGNKMFIEKTKENLIKKL